ncbi:MAG: 8-oxoguanine DNA glycosylase, partial [Methanomicrobiales archaeon HGW-Methanomicrobiales-4]
MKKYVISDKFLPFDLDQTLSCGQVFRWKKDESEWNGVIKDSVITIRQEGQTLIYNGIEEQDLIQYFNLDLNVNEVIIAIRTAIKHNTGGGLDPLFETAEKIARGLRIIRQDPWECLISFICSQNSNIPAIKKRIDLICSRFGVLLPGGYFQFPSAHDLACHDSDTIRECSTGYRASYLVDTARYVVRNPDFLNRLSYLPVEDARQELLYLPGVGPKVADCVLLFGYNFYEVVPVDVWIRAIMSNGYPDLRKRACNRKECSYS